MRIFALLNDRMKELQRIAYAKPLVKQVNRHL
jgi:hypothetical protein